MEVRKKLDGAPMFTETNGDPELSFALAAGAQMVATSQDIARVLYSGLELQSKLGQGVEMMIKESLSREKLSVWCLTRVL